MIIWQHQIVAKYSELELNKTKIIITRRVYFLETRDDQQIATFRRFEVQDRVTVAYDEKSIILKLEELSNLKPGKAINRQASPELLERLRNFVDPL